MQHTAKIAHPITTASFYVEGMKFEFTLPKNILMVMNRMPAYEVADWLPIILNDPRLAECVDAAELRQMQESLELLALSTERIRIVV